MKIFSFLCLWLTCCILQAQPYQLVWDHQSPYPAGGVYDITRDLDGNFWVISHNQICANCEDTLWLRLDKIDVNGNLLLEKNMIYPEQKNVSSTNRLFVTSANDILIYHYNLFHVPNPVKLLVIAQDGTTRYERGYMDNTMFGNWNGPGIPGSSSVAGFYNDRLYLLCKVNTNNNHRMVVFDTTLNEVAQTQLPGNWSHIYNPKKPGDYFSFDNDGIRFLHRQQSGNNSLFYVSTLDHTLNTICSEMPPHYFAMAKRWVFCSTEDHSTSGQGKFTFSVDQWGNQSGNHIYYTAATYTQDDCDNESYTISPNVPGFNNTNNGYNTHKVFRFDDETYIVGETLDPLFNSPYGNPPSKVYIKKLVNGVFAWEKYIVPDPLVYATVLNDIAITSDRKIVVSYTIQDSSIWYSSVSRAGITIVQPDGHMIQLPYFDSFSYNYQMYSYNRLKLEITEDDQLFFAGSYSSLNSYNGNGGLINFGLFDLNTLSSGNYENPSMRAYPNPASDIVYISDPDKFTDITLLYADGRTAASANNGSISVQHLPAGLYILQATDMNGKRLTEKIIIQ